MEESGENWPYNSDLEISDEAILKDGESESVCEDQIGDPTDNTKENNEKEMLKELSDVMGLKKMDEISIIENARDYVATLQERVRELEQEDGSNIYSDEYSCGTSDNTLPEVKAKVLQKDVLVIVHCEEQNGILLKILTYLENLHLSVVNSRVLNFGKSILDITIVAKMDDGYNLKVDELVKTMRIAISTQ